MNSTTLVAVYGAFLSTIAIGWNIYNNLQDKPKIKVSAKFGFMSDNEKIFLFIKAINKGRRPITLSSVGLRSGNEDLLNIKTISLPYELKESTSHLEWFDVSELENRQFDFAWYKDETGKLYKSKSIRKKLNNYFNSKRNKNTLIQKSFKGELIQ
ncbi:MAG: hypothetical protein KJ771_07565 [Nanoarchaeota archaeon]|nr:hypothetical protein [Nanoarchaeota archaeon]